MQEHFMVNATSYIIKVVPDPGETVPTYYVRTLSTHIHDMNKNITWNNWFTSVDLVKRMLSDF